jgi:hypothetical protein
MGQGIKAAVRNGEQDGTIIHWLLLTGSRIDSMDRRDGLWSLAWRRLMDRRLVAVHSKGYDEWDRAMGLLSLRGSLPFIQRDAMNGTGPWGCCRFHSKDYVHRSKEVMNTTYVI